MSKDEGSVIPTPLAEDVAGDDAVGVGASSLFGGVGDGSGSRVDLAHQLAITPGNTEALNQLSALAARLLHTASSHVSLISNAQTVVGGVGSSGPAVGLDSSLEDSVCAVTVSAGAPLMVEDATTDPRVRDLDSVQAGVVGSYLGVPLIMRGQPVGALCVYDPAPRRWSDEDVVLLEQLAAPVLAELQLAVLAAEHEDERLLWQLAVDAAEVGAFDWNLQTDELRWDERLLRLFGLDRETFGGTIDAFNAAVHPDDRDRVTEALRVAIATCGPYAAEYRIHLPDGVVRWVAARGRGLAGPDGPSHPAVRVLGAAFDTTAVQDGEARVARVLETMPTAFFHLDHEWRFTYLNTEGRRLLGGIGTEIVGAIIWDLFPDTVGSNFEVQYRRAVETGEPVEFEAYYPPPLDDWYEIRAWPSPDGLSVYFFKISARVNAQRAAVDATERTAVLSSITEMLTGTLDIEEAVTNLARAVVGPLADWSVVTLVDHPAMSSDSQTYSAGSMRAWRRGLRDVAGWHIDPAVRGQVDRYLEVRIPALSEGAFLARALRQNRPVVIAAPAAEAIAGVLEPGEAQELCRALAPASAVVVPLQGRGRTVGLLTVFRGEGRDGFSAEDVSDLVDAAGRAGLALDNARLYAEQRELAEALQRSLMTAPPEPENLHIVVRYEPAAETAQVGGDWYDAFLQPDGATSIVIGDVVGHDTAAAAAMGQVRGLLRGIAVSSGEGPADVLRRVDEAMQTLQIETTATAIVARLEQTPEERSTGRARLRWSNAGHPPPLVAGPGEEPETSETTAAPHVQVPTVAALWSERSDLLLGLEPSFERTETVTALTRGSTVLLYTDGLVERRGQGLDVGVEKLRGVLAELVDSGLSLEEMCDELIRRMLPERPEDDVALVALRLQTRLSRSTQPSSASPMRVRARRGRARTTRTSRSVHDG